MWSRHELSRRSFLGGVVAAGSALVACSVASAGPAATSAARRRGNVRVTNDSFTAHVETCIAVNPRNPRNLLGACIVSGTKGANDGVAAYASFDGGESWQSSGLLGPGDDPTVAFDAGGHGFICAGGLRLWRTDDGGRTFGSPVAAVAPEKTDHPWLAVDRFSDPSGGNLYAVWTGTNNTKLGFTRSIDGGRSFEPERAIAGLSGPGETVVASPMAAAAPHGGVHAIYGVWPPVSTSGTHRPEIIGHIRVVSSNDFGVTFGDPIELGMGAMEILMSGGAASSPGLPAIAASPHGDAVYAAFVTHQAGADHTDLVIAASGDRGRSWGPPTPVTSGTEPVFYFQPQITVDEAGRIGVSAFALRNGRIDVVLFVSAPNRVRFGSAVLVTDASFDPANGGEAGGSKHGAWWIGDYQGLTSTQGAFHPFWNDTRTGALEIFTASVPAGRAGRS